MACPLLCMGDHNEQSAHGENEKSHKKHIMA